MTRVVEYGKTLPVNSIVVEERARQEKGDLTTLKESIQREGLLNPITVTEDNKLVAGERRLLATKELGKSSIMCNIIKVTKKNSAYDMDLVELLENVARLNLRWDEEATLNHRIHEHLKRTKSTKKEEWTFKRTAEMLGISATELGRRCEMATLLDVLPTLRNEETSVSAQRKAKSALRAVKAKRHTTATEQEGGEDREWWEDEEEDEDEGEGEADAGEKKEKKDTKAHSIKLLTHGYKIGDALEEMQNKKIHEQFCFAEVDPPYGIDLVESARPYKTLEMEGYQEVEAEAYPEFYAKVADGVYKCLLPDSFAVFWYGHSWYSVVKEAIEGAGFKVNPVPAIWTKPAGQTMAPHTNFANCYEPFFLARKGSPSLQLAARRNVFDFNVAGQNTKFHATQKPYKLMDSIIETVIGSFSGKILVPFMGSGVTAMAYINRKQHFDPDVKGNLVLGWDLDKEARNKSIYMYTRLLNERHNFSESL